MIIHTYWFNKIVIIVWAENSLIHDKYLDTYKYLKITKLATFHITYEIWSYSVKKKTNSPLWNREDNFSVFLNYITNEVIKNRRITGVVEKQNMKI